MSLSFARIGNKKGSEQMTYYVISPNVWNDGAFEPHVNFMLKNHVVCMGWDRGGRSGDMFAKIKPGDRVIVARRNQWKWRTFFIAIVDGYAKYDSETAGHFTQACDIRSIVDVRDESDLLAFTEEMTGFSKKNPGSIFRLHQENEGDRRFVSVVEKLLQQKRGELSFAVREIANWRENGRVAIPALQRGLVWEPRQVELLWDSILRGFPIGSFVFSGVSPQSRQRTQNTDVDAEFFLLDGQQRSNAIATVFNDGADAESMVWIDLIPAHSHTRRFRVKVTTSAHPWGFKNDDECSVLNAVTIRTAIRDFTKLSYSEIANYDVSLLKLDQTWPVAAGCPVPLGKVIKWFDLYGAELSAFRDRLLSWIMSDKNLSGKGRDESEWAGLEGEIEKLHFALGHLHEYRVFANFLSQDIINAEDGELSSDNTSNLEGLFTRLNTLGSHISAYDLRYSAIKAYWGDIKDVNDSIASRIMPGANLAMFSFRIALTLASEGRGVVHKLSDVPAIGRIRKLGRGGESEEDRETVRIVREELYNGRLQNIVDDVERALNVYAGEGSDTNGMPPYLRTSIIFGSPDVYLLLMIMAYHHMFDGEAIRPIYAAFALYAHWMCKTNKKSLVDYVYGRLCETGFTSDNFVSAIRGQVGVSLFPLPRIATSDLRGEDNRIATYWQKPTPMSFLGRIQYNFELLIFSERAYFNGNFKYDPAHANLLKGKNKPWDYDHIVPKDWVSNKKIGDYREVCKYWLWTIGNFAAIPFSINRSKSNAEEWSEYLFHADELNFNRRVGEINQLLVRDKMQADLFCEITAERMIKIYDTLRLFVCKSIGIGENMCLPEDVEE